ncbi:MAG TPA: DUF58 domain-containing protein [Myxococcaceae bacterium]|nr:DUF58 domain-containing protein [Myxococcaceae bacterium]
MLPRELIRRIRRLEIATRRVVANLLAGQYHSVFKGRGMAFSEVRPYQPGDEIRSIDWNVTARMNDAHVKVFAEERELTVMLLVDVSGSQGFGSQGRTKAEMAAEVAAQIAFSAIANNDRVGLVLFSDRVERVIPPKKGRKHVLRVVTEILEHRAAGRGTDLAAGLTWLLRVSKRRAVTFVISDFLVDDYEVPLRTAARTHDVIPVVTRDPFEDAFPHLGLVELEDPETGRRALVDTSRPSVAGGFRAAMAARRAQRTQVFRRLELDAVELRAGEDHGEALVRFFRSRARRLAA